MQANTTTKALILLISVLVILLHILGCGTEPNDDYEEYYPHEFKDGNHYDFLEENNWDYNLCVWCHGDDLQGLVTHGPSCFTCHETHVSVFGTDLTGLSHSTYLRDNGYPLSDCVSCHAADFGGTIFADDCGICHTQEEGPLACNTCHGDRNGDSEMDFVWAPPYDLSNNDDRNSVTVGAHQEHLTTDIAAKMSCDACHQIPESWDADNHIDDSPAEVAMKGYDKNDAAWDRESATCSNVYCHRSSEPIWTDTDDKWGECLSCHQTELTGHAGSTSFNECARCHSEVVDDSGTIINVDLHINGTNNINI